MASRRQAVRLYAAAARDAQKFSKHHAYHYNKAIAASGPGLCGRGAVATDADAPKRNVLYF